MLRVAVTIEQIENEHLQNLLTFRVWIIWGAHKFWGVTAPECPLWLQSSSYLGRPHFFIYFKIDETNTTMVYIKFYIHFSFANTHYPVQANQWDKCNLTRFSTNFRFKVFSWMLPRVTENAVTGYMRPVGLFLDHTDLVHSKKNCYKVVKILQLIFTRIINIMTHRFEQTRTVARKSSIRGFTIAQGVLTLKFW